MKRHLIYIYLFIFASTQIIFAQVENESTKHPILTSKFQLSVGLFISRQSLNFSLDAASNNQEINFGETFDFKNSSGRPQFSFDWRFAKKWKVSAEYFNANYSEKAELEEDIEKFEEYVDEHFIKMNPKYPDIISISIYEDSENND